jgi:thioredoxin reductase (NADPH)
MTKPVLMAVDDDRAVLSAVAADLRAQYGKDLRILTASSGEEADAALRELRLRETPVALVLADQRMPGITGVDLLRTARELHPEAKRVLLTAYADTDAAIAAINSAQLDHYLLKPWDPPQTRLYPVLDDLLEDWWATFRPPFEGLRIIGHRWSRTAHDLKEFLARNQVPYRWLDVETDADAGRLLESAGMGAESLPVVVYADGSVAAHPERTDVAEHVGLRTTASLPFYDLIVVGAGPAGLAASVYGASEGLQTLLVEQLAPGGQAGTSALIENYLGFPKGLSGAELARRARTQAVRFGAELVHSQEAVGLALRDGYPVLRTEPGGEVAARAVIVASGVAYRTLDVPGADALTGSGIYYAAGLEEAAAHADEDVAVVGGGNSAGQAVLFLARSARSVTLLVRSDSLTDTMSRYLIDQITESPHAAVRYGVEVTQVEGAQRLESVHVEDRASKEPGKLAVGALFVYIGMTPRTTWLPDDVVRDRGGFVLTGPDVMLTGRTWSLRRQPLPLETSTPGIFAAGDVRAGSTKRVASAVGEGAMAVRFVHEHLAS